VCPPDRGGCGFGQADPAAREFYPDFIHTAHTTVALLRTEAGRGPFNKSLTGLIGELSTRSEEFRALWAAHNVRLHRSGLKHFHHPVIGRMDLMFEAMALEADEGLTLTAYTAEPGSPSHDALRLLASWAATSCHESATESGALSRASDQPVGRAPVRRFRPVTEAPSHRDLEVLRASPDTGTPLAEDHTQ
jgi:hypothetical protein